MKNDMKFADLLVENGVTSARMDILLEQLDDEDGGDFLATYPGRYIKRLVNDIKRAFDRNTVEAQPFYTLEDAERLHGAVSLLFEDDYNGTRITEETMDEVEAIEKIINRVYREYLKGETQ